MKKCIILNITEIEEEPKIIIYIKNKVSANPFKNKVFINPVIKENIKEKEKKK
jgi:hypothetical protein